MSDKMKIIKFRNLVNLIFNEYSKHKTIFGIPEEKFFKYKKESDSKYFNINIFDDFLETPFGPAAGPHTQLVQNIISSYLTGARFIELKTVQIMDDLEIPKPCIDAEDEGYNTEWSQELSLNESLDEYIKAWIILHILKEKFNLSDNKENSGFIFNMSVGYDLKGIKSEKMDNFIENMLHPKKLIDKYKEIINKEFPEFKNIKIPYRMINSVTISTMHGCPPDEIEAIAKYLIKEKKLHTYIKLNPTLIGKKEVENILFNNGFEYIKFKDETFNHDLQYNDAIKMIKQLKEFAKKHGKIFGVKLSNTLANINVKKRLPGDERYMSGRALFPITINLANKLSKEFDGKLNISFSGGAFIENIKQILDTNIYPVTMATNLLKPGGYLRYYQIAKKLEQEKIDKNKNSIFKYENIDLKKLDYLTKVSRNNDFYKKAWDTTSLKLDTKLNHFDCIVAPCVVECPIHQDIPDYIEAIEQEDYTKSLEIILKKNALPNITGFICDHKCQTKCVRHDYDSSLKIRDLKKVAALNGDYNLIIDKYLEQIKKKNKNKKVAIIGGGPGGMGVAYYLRREGYNVTIFEKREKLGGTVRYTIPAFRLPDEVIDTDVEILKDIGVKIITNYKNDINIDDFKSKGFNYIVLATGAEKPRKLKINSEDVQEGYIEGVDFLRMVKEGKIKNIGNKVIIIGGGDSAMDAARTAFRLTNGEVSIVYRRDIKNMPADKEEITEVIEEGIKIKQLLSPVEIITEQGKVKGLKCQKMKLGEEDSSGRRRPVPIENEYEIIEADMIISAIGETVDTEIASKNNVKILNGKTIYVDPETYETNIKGVYAAGDCVRGASTVVKTLADAKKVSSTIIKKDKTFSDYLVDEFYKLEDKRNIKQKTLKRGEQIFYDPVKRIPLDERKSFNQVILPLNKIEAKTEASRCFSCNIACNKCVEVCPNRANVAIDFNLVSYEIPYFNEGKIGYMLYSITQNSQILHIDDYCNECGNCETFCPHNGKPYKDKITLYSDEKMFNENDNDGFLLLEKNKKFYKFLCKVDKKMFFMEIDNNSSLVIKDEKIELHFTITEKKLILKNYKIGNINQLNLKGYIDVFEMVKNVINKYDYLLNY